MKSAVDTVLSLARPELRALKAYEHARWDPTLERLHANESPWPPAGMPGAALNRYPEPQPTELVSALAKRYGVNAEQVLVARGSDEGIDLLTRAFCPSGQSSVIVCPPTFGMYAVAARIQGAQVIEIPLDADFQPNTEAIASALNDQTRIVWVCSPNNPTGNLIERRRLDTLLNLTVGRALLVIDEAYGEFAPEASLVAKINSSPHLVILRTLSKAAALAGARVGSVLAHPEVIALLRKLIPPYALPSLSIDAALASQSPAARAVEHSRITQLIEERDRLVAQLNALRASRGVVRRVWPSAANFVLVELADRAPILQRLSAAGLLVRDVGGRAGLGEALRITVGTRDQNDRLLATLRSENQSDP